MIKRECGSCTKCCEGYLYANIFGHEMKTGTPCYFLKNSKCSIYEKRPEHPCKKFFCGWMLDETILEEMKPDISNAIITIENLNGVKCARLTQCGDNISEKIIEWFIQWSNKNFSNYMYQKNGTEFYFGQEISDAVKLGLI